MLRMTTLAAISTLALASHAAAAEFDPLVVAGDAKFLIFVDLEAAGKTAVGGWILDRIKENPDYQKFEEVMINLAGFMPASDIQDVTIYGSKYAEPSDASLVIRANFDGVRLGDALTLAPEFKSDVHNGHTLLSWTDENNGKRVHACIADDRTIVMNGGSEQLKAALDVLDSQEKSLNEKSSLPRPKPGVWAFAVGTELGTSPGVKGNELLRGFLERATIEVAQQDANAVMSMKVMMQTAEQAQSTRSIFEGLKGFALLAANAQAGQSDEKARLAGELAKMATTQVEGNDVLVTLTIRNDTATQILNRVVELRDKLPH